MENRVVVLGDENTKVGLQRINLETIIGHSYKFEPCLTLSTFLEQLGQVPSGVRHIIIDCLSNVVHTLMLGASMEATLTEGMMTIGEAVKVLVARNTGLRVYIAQPIPRKSTESREACVFSMRMLVSHLRMVPTVWVLSWSTTLDVMPSGLMTDASCKQFLEEFIRFIKPRMTKDRHESIAMYEAEHGKPMNSTQTRILPTLSINEGSQLLLDEDEEMNGLDDVFREGSATMQATGSGTSLEHLATKVSVRALEAKVIRQTRFVEKFYTEYKTRRILDMIAFADQAERADFASNKLREDWVVVSGLRGKEFPKDIAEQNKVAMTLMTELVRKVLGREEDLSVNVKMVFEKKFARGTGETILPPIEVKMKTAVAFEFRTKAANMAKSKVEGFQGVYFGVSTTLGTRIRCDILKVLCKRLNEKHPALDHYCIANGLRPLMSCGPKGVKGGRKTLLYVEAVRKYIEVFAELDLSEPYKRARDFFNGRLEHTFAVLYEEEDRPQSSGVTGSNAIPLGATNAITQGVKRYLSTAPGGSVKKYQRN